ncbi:MAG: CYTH domain-containing protein [Lachnospiraceae bacterium]|nr:CYTH domain-containing protein [Lachnospiraceae bacterium]
MEIERKYLIDVLPSNLEDYPFHRIEQAYLCTAPVIRVRRQDDDYILTYKGKGMMMREEYNLPLTAEAYAHLLSKADGNILTKKRYLIPLTRELKIELDLFEGKFAGLQMAEVEFPDEESANTFTPPDWFGREVTYDPAYHNSNMSQCR